MSETKAFRLKFEKTGSMKYISHLDLNRLFSRSLARARIEAAHSEGFNPHPKISFASALSLGVESLCEFADAKIIGAETGETIMKKAKGAFPAGLEIIEAYAPENDFANIDRTRFHIFLSPEGFEISEIEKLLLGDVCVEKKPGVLISLKDFVCEMAISKKSPEYLRIDTVLKTSRQMFLNPENIIKAIKSQYAAEWHFIKKIETYDKNGDIFR
ncbi:MAG: TIGR03936 family radical SAM-associated protein [Oscillospiraceae bacterium]|nr:TIGR03936 family radical SAM-associated protein [Oscillospiraceae bacterium]